LENLFYLDSYTLLTYSCAVEIIETFKFTKLVDDYLSEDEFFRLKLHLALKPTTSMVIPGTGGCRKLRWRGSGRGKRGGYRIIYYLQDRAGMIWLLTIYAKNEAVDIPRSMLRKWREEIEL